MDALRQLFNWLQLPLHLVFAAGIAFILLGALGWKALADKRQLGSDTPWLNALKSERVARLRTLTPEQKRLVRELVEGSPATRRPDLDDDLARGLQRAGVVRQVGHLTGGVAFDLEPWVRECLLDDPTLI